MKVELFSEGGRDAQSIDASRVLIRDAFGNPIVFAAQYVQDGKSCCIVSTIDDPQFETLLATVGARASVVRNRVEAPSGRD